MWLNCVCYWWWSGRWWGCWGQQTITTHITTMCPDPSCGVTVGVGQPGLPGPLGADVVRRWCLCWWQVFSLLPFSEHWLSVLSFIGIRASLPHRLCVSREVKKCAAVQLTENIAENLLTPSTSVVPAAPSETDETPSPFKLERLLVTVSRRQHGERPAFLVNGKSSLVKHTYTRLYIR